MKTLSTQQVYIVDGCAEDKLPADRLQRVMRGIRAETVSEVTCGEMDQIAAEQGGRFGEPGSPHIIFANFQWRWFGPSSLDPEYAALLQEAERNGGEMIFRGDHIFPHEARSRLNRFIVEEVRSINSEVPIALCRETPEMWDEFGEELRLSPARCACGSPPRG